MTKVVYLGPGDMPSDTTRDYAEVHTYRQPSGAGFLSDITFVPVGRVASGTFGDPVQGAEMTFPEAVDLAKRLAEERGIGLIYARDDSAAGAGRPAP